MILPEGFKTRMYKIMLRLLLAIYMNTWKGYKISEEDAEMIDEAKEVLRQL